MSAGEIRFDHHAFGALSVDALHDLLRLRGAVFVEEQGIWQENDLDGTDPDSVHVRGRLPDGALVAAARLRLTASPAVVSRVVVRRDHRGHGVGAALMRYVQQVLGSTPAVMSAQAELEAWYRRLGWMRDGPTYDEVGIPHVRMVWGGK